MRNIHVSGYLLGNVITMRVSENQKTNIPIFQVLKRVRRVLRLLDLYVCYVLIKHFMPCNSQTFLILYLYGILEYWNILVNKPNGINNL